MNSSASINVSDTDSQLSSATSSTSTSSSDTDSQLAASTTSASSSSDADSQLSSATTSASSSSDTDSELAATTTSASSSSDADSELGLSVSFAALSSPLLNQSSLPSDSDGDESETSSSSLATALLVLDSDQLLVLIAPLELDVNLLQGVQIILVSSEVADDDNLLSWHVDSLSVGLVLQALVVSVDFSVLQAFSSSSSSEAELLGRIASVGSARSLSVAAGGSTDFDTTSDGFLLLFSSSNAAFSSS